MPNATVTFRRCVVNAPELGCDEQHVGSRIYFDLDVEGKQFFDLYTDIRQTIGWAAEGESLEVTPPIGYSGPLNFPIFEGLVGFYFRHVIGAQGFMFGSKATTMRFVGYVLEQEMKVQCEIDE